MINRNANKTMYHDLGRIITVSFAAGIEAANRKEQAQREKALARKARLEAWRKKEALKNEMAR